MQPGFLMHLKELSYILPRVLLLGGGGDGGGVDRSGLLTREKLKVTPAFVKEADKTRNAYGAELSAG